MKQYIFVLIFLCLPFFLFAAPSVGAGKLYHKNKLNILELHGNYYQMGKQYGSLLKKQIRYFYHDYFEKQLAPKKSQLDYLTKTLAPKLWQNYSARQQQLILGVAKGAGMRKSAIVLLDNSFLLGAILPRSYNACSFVSVWGPFTRDGSLLVARNLDWMPTFAKYRNMVSVVIYHPTDGSHAVATVVMPGMVNGVTAFNDAGLYISVNDGSNSAGHRFYADRMLYLNQMLSFLFNSGSFAALQHEVKTVRANFAMIIAIADAKQALIYEDAPFAIRERAAKPFGLLVATNDYLLPQWQPIHSKDYVMSKIRYRHLYQQAMRLRGKFDVKQLQQLMDKPLITKTGQLGPGVTEYNTGKHEATITLYQVIVKPSARELWVRVPNYTGWTALTLGK